MAERLKVFYSQYVSTCKGLYSLSGKTSYRQISLCLDGARLDVIIIISLWHLTCISAAVLPRCLSNFRVIRKSRPKSRGLEISRNLAVRRPSVYWIEAFVVDLPQAVHANTCRDFTTLWSLLPWNENMCRWFMIPWCILWSSWWWVLSCIVAWCRTCNMQLFLQMTTKIIYVLLGLCRRCYFHNFSGLCHG